MHSQSQSHGARIERSQEFVWMLGGGSMQRIMAEEVLRRGYGLIISDKIATCACAPLADLMLPIDTMDIEGHLTACDEITRVHNVVGVVTFAHDAHLTVSTLAMELGLPSAPIELSTVLSSKVDQREAMRLAGLMQPRSSAHSTAATALDAVRELVDAGCNVLVKQDRLSGSRGLERIRPADNVAAVVAAVNRSLRCSTGRVIVEEQLHAETEYGTSEQSVEFVVTSSGVELFNSVDRFFDCDLKWIPQVGKLRLGPGVEFGHLNPSMRSSDYFNQVTHAVTTFLSSVDYGRDAAFILKADVFSSANGPVILEMTLRSSGGWDSSCSTPARGGALHSLVLDMATGQVVTPGLGQPVDARFVGVATDADETFKDCIGRRFAVGDLSDDPGEAMVSALEAVRQERFLP